MVWTVLALLIGLFAFTVIAGSHGETALAASFPWQFRLAAKLRTPVLVFIVVPLSFLMWLRTSVRRQLALFKQPRSKEQVENDHAAAVDEVVVQIKAWNAAGRRGKLRTARPNWASMSTKLASNKTDAHRISVGHLNRILEVNVEAMTIKVEPGVTFGEITDVLLPLALALQTHVEMESITIGGCALGFGIETNSHKTGFFQESVVEYEIVDSYGKVHVVSKESDAELFYALPWSYGTLGFGTAITLRLVQCKPYVRMVYEPTCSSEELERRLTQYAAMAEPPEFLEATMFTPTDAVIQAGWYSDGPIGKDARLRVSPINHFWKPFFYRHVETFLGGAGGEELLPLKHFLHRFTRSIFWEIEDMIPFSNHPLYRVLWGWMGAPEVSLLKLFQGPVIRKASVYAHVVQESIMPLRSLPDGLRLFDNVFGVYPLLVFPVRVWNRGELSGFVTPPEHLLEPSASGERTALYVDVGAYGVPREVKRGGRWDAKASIRKMEEWTHQVGGWEALYTDIACTRREFRALFDHTLQDKVRTRMGGDDAFTEVYDKVRPEAGIIDLSAEMGEEASKCNGKH
jgi:delta24-sterol reductase